MNDDQVQFNMNKLIPKLYKSKIRFRKWSIITSKIYAYLIIYKIKLCYKYLQIGKSKELNTVHIKFTITLSSSILCKDDEH